MNNHIKKVTSFEYLKERFDESVDYFASSTKVEFDRIGFDDSTWHQELTPSYMLSDEDYNRVIRVWFPNSLKVDDDESFTSYSITYANDEKGQYYSDIELFSAKELDDVLGFLWSNLELLNELVDVDRQKRDIEEHNDTMNITINCLNDIYENILSDIFYDMSWDDLKNEYEDKQNDMLVALEKAIDIIKKERK